MKNNLFTKEKVPGQWVTGITDAEGCFSVVVHIKKKRVQFAFKVTQSQLGTNLLFWCNIYFGCGHMAIDNAANKAIKFIITKSEYINRVIHHFTVYPLQTSKQLDFLCFKKAWTIYNDDTIPLDDRIEQVIELKNQMNNSRSHEEKWIFMKNRSYNITKAWVQAFVDGEGCFYSFTHKTKNIVQLSLEIAQHSSNRILLEHIKNFFGHGYLKPRCLEESLESSMKIRSVSRLIITNTEAVIQFFDEHPLYSSKNISYNVYKQVAFLKGNNFHKTEFGMNLMRRLKVSMDTSRLLNTDILPIKDKVNLINEFIRIDFKDINNENIGNDWPQNVKNTPVNIEYSDADENDAVIDQTIPMSSKESNSIVKRDQDIKINLTQKSKSESIWNYVVIMLIFGLSLLGYILSRCITEDHSCEECDEKAPVELDETKHSPDDKSNQDRDLGKYISTEAPEKDSLDSVDTEDDNSIVNTQQQSIGTENNSNAMVIGAEEIGVENNDGRMTIEQENIVYETIAHNMRAYSLNQLQNIYPDLNVTAFDLTQLDEVIKCIENLDNEAKDKNASRPHLHIIIPEESSENAVSTDTGSSGTDSFEEAVRLIRNRRDSDEVDVTTWSNRVPNYNQALAEQASNFHETLVQQVDGELHANRRMLGEMNELSESQNRALAYFARARQLVILSRNIANGNLDGIDLGVGDTTQSTQVTEEPAPDTKIHEMVASSPQLDYVPAIKRIGECNDMSEHYKSLIHNPNIPSDRNQEWMEEEDFGTEKLFEQEQVEEKK